MTTRASWQPGSAWLFCPADRPERYAKALAVADVVILDLEDAVAPERRDRARDALRSRALAGDLDPDRTVVRINSSSSTEHALDWDLIESTLRPAGLDRIMLAKTESAADAETLDGCDVVALLETPLGVQDADLIAAGANVVAVMWGADDLIAGLGGSTSRRPDGTYRDVARHARSRALIAAKVAGRLALDSVYMDIPDLEGLREETDDAVAVGFDAKVAIHPSQVAVIAGSFRPRPDELSWAQGLLAAAAEVGFGVFTYEGRMVDGPVFAQARRILARAGG